MVRLRRIASIVTALTTLALIALPQLLNTSSTQAQSTALSAKMT